MTECEHKNQVLGDTKFQWANKMTERSTATTPASCKDCGTELPPITGLAFEPTDHPWRGYKNGKEYKGGDRPTRYRVPQLRGKE